MWGVFRGRGNGCTWLIRCLLTINPSERKGTLYGVDICQRMHTCKASRCLEVGIRIRRSKKLSLTLKNKAGRSNRSKVMDGAVYTALTTTGMGA
jgi:hypothetical protein